MLYLIKLRITNYCTNTSGRVHDLLSLEGGVFMSGGVVHGGGFALLVVLFILLIIIGATWLC